PIERLFVGESERGFHVLWRESGGGSAVIRHQSFDLNTWSAVDDLKVPVRSGAETFAVSRCGRVHFATEAIRDGRLEILYASLDESWSTLRPVLAEHVPSDPRLSRGEGDEILFTFIGRALSTRSTS